MSEEIMIIMNLYQELQDSLELISSASFMSGELPQLDTFIRDVKIMRPGPILSTLLCTVIQCSGFQPSRWPAPTRPLPDPRPPAQSHEMRHRPPSSRLR